MLQAEGLVDAAPNRGATVRSHSVEDLDDLYQLRAVLEGYADAPRRDRAVGRGDRRTARELRPLRGLARATTTDMSELVKENLVFHQTILEGAGSARLGGDGPPGDRAAARLPLLHLVLARAAAISAHYHHQITRALEARDAERAELVMKEHIFEARDLLLAHWRELEAAEE